MTFGPSDPSGAGGIQADLLTGASLGCHVVTVTTALLVRDTANTESVQPVAAECVDDQARCLLEDMPVKAFKVSGLYTPEAVSAVAQVVADYPEVPLVLHLGTDSPKTTESGDEDTAEDALLAQLELLGPQGHVVMVDHHRLESWYSEGLLARGDTENALQALLNLGPRHVFLTNVPHAGGAPVNVLAEQAPQAEAWVWQTPPGSYRGVGSTLSAAIAAMLARERPLREAVIDAQRFTRRAMESAYQPGMGREVLDRFFWVRSSDDETGEGPDASPTTKDGKSG